MRTKNNLSRTLRGRVAMTVIVALLTIFALPTTALAATFTEDGLNYEVTSESPYEVEVDRNSSASGTLTIPATVTHDAIVYSVTSIGNKAFWYCTSLTSVTIPASVTSIGQDAFRDCTGLTSVTIPASVTSIGQGAFLGCEGLTSVNIPASVTSIGQDAFRSCTGLTSVTIPNSVTSIGQGAFFGCSGLTSVTIGNSVTSIGQEVFRGCSGLTSVTIPNSVTSIDQNAFLGCKGLTSVNIPASVTSIGEGAFFNCTGLTSVTIGNSVTSIGQDAFYNCSHLTSVTIYAPNPPVIGSNAFHSNPSDRMFYVFESSKSAYESAWSAYNTNLGNFHSISDVTLSDLTVNANPQKTGEYWCTYYHPLANVKIKTSGVTIYKAVLNSDSTQVAVIAVSGNNVIKGGQAVMLKTTSNSPLSMELTPEVPTGYYNGNDLKGGNAVPAGYDAYTLGKSGIPGYYTMGFYRYIGTTLDPNKAHLEILSDMGTSGTGGDSPVGPAVPGTPSREFIDIVFDASDGDGDATRLKEEIIKNKEIKSEWYTLSGARMSSVPTKKGVYIYQGKRVIR